MKTSDTDLIQRVLDGDQDAFTTLVNRYQKWIHGLVWRKVGDFHIAEEITQDVFLKAYRKLSMLKPPYHFSGWLYVIASRRCIAWHRKKQSPTTSLDAMPTVQLEEVSYSQYEIARGEAASVEHQRDLVKRLLEKLPESERTVVTLHYVSEMPCKEISEFLGVSPNTIKSRLHRARERLKKHEHLLHDVSSIFQLPPTLTDNIMREVARIKPVSPVVSKPWLPWGLSVASALMFILMMGIGQSALLRFQQPYSLDATSEIAIELVETPIVLPLKIKPDVKTQPGNTNTVGQSSSVGSKTDVQLLSTTQSETVDVLETEPQWTQAKALTGGNVDNLFLTSEKILYAVGDTGLYRLDENGTEWTLVNTSLPLTHQSEPMAEWDGTLYIATQTDLFTSTDHGETWSSVGSRPQGRAIALIVTDPNQVSRPQDAQIEMYLVLTNGVFRSTDAGSTWHAFGDGLNQPEIQTVTAIGDVLFLGTKQGLYRLNANVWEKLPVAQARSVDSLAVTGNRIYFSAEGRGDRWSRSFFVSDDLGDSWINITPTDLGRRAFPLTAGSVKLVAVDETILVLGAGVLRSEDAGNTWEYLGFDKHAVTFGTSPVVALDKNTIFVAGTTSGIGRSTDGGSTWNPFMTGITELHVLDLAQVNNVLYATTNKGIAKSTDGGELWTSVGRELSPPSDNMFGELQLSNMTTIGDSLYVRAKQDGNTNYFFHLLPSTDKFLPITGMPVYMDSSHSELLESIAYTSGTSDLDKTDQVDIPPYQFDIKKATAKTTGEFAVSSDMFYIEYDRKLYRWTLGDLRWKDIGVQDEPVFADFYATDGFQFAASGKVIYLGKSNGLLCQSLNGGDTWRDVTSDLPFPLNKVETQDQTLNNLPYFKEIVFAGSTVYVATNDGVVTSDDGENWRILTNSESFPIVMHQLVVDGTALYGISHTGVYRLNNDTDTWMQITSEVPERVTSLVVAENVLYIGTEHRGLLRLPLHNL